MAYRSARRSSPRPGRWMDLKKAGKCHVCSAALPAGVRAFYEPSDRSVTCTAVECADVAGLTEEKWLGSPVSGKFVTVLADHRTGRDHSDPFAKTRSRGYYGRDAGRCEDAPCCGCCS